MFYLGSDVPDSDERAYLVLAENLVGGLGMQRGGAPETHISPLFPALHAAVIRLGVDPQVAGRWTGLATSALAVPAAAWALLPVLGRRWALAAGALVLVHPRLLVTAERIQPEALAATCLLLFAGCWARRWRIGSGAAAAAAYLTRPEGFFLLPLTWIVVAFRDRAGWRRWLGATAVALLLMSPYLIHLRRATGGWTLTGKVEWVYALGRVESVSGNRPIDRADLARPEFDVGGPLDHLRSDPAEAAGDYVRRLGFAAGYLGRETTWPLFLLALVGVGLAARGEPRSAGWWPPLGLLVVIPLAVVHSRHLLPYVPILLGGAVYAARWGVLRWAQARAAQSARQVEMSR